MILTVINEYNLIPDHQFGFRRFGIICRYSLVLQISIRFKNLVSQGFRRDTRSFSDKFKILLNSEKLLLKRKLIAINDGLVSFVVIH